MSGPPSPKNRPGGPSRASGRPAGRSRKSERLADNEWRPRRSPAPSPVASGCFVGSSLVWTPHGCRPIKEIAVGDSIYSWEPSTRSLVVRPVTRVLRHRAQPVWTLELAGNVDAIRTTACHTVFATTGWTRVDRLSVGDRIIHPGPESSGVEIKAILGPSGEEEVYNLHTLGEHNFIVQGIVAHNFTILRRTRTLLHRFFLDRRIFARSLPQSIGVLRPQATW